MPKTNKKTATNETNDTSVIRASFRIISNKQDRVCGGRWVMGTIGGHKFEALVFAESARRGWICQLTVEQIKDGKTVASYCLDWDRRPTTRETRNIVNVLVEGLAEAAL